jgi:alanyl aminopeptidase
LQKFNVVVIAHEFAHQWFGDLVTLAWWDDVWLNEAFASWMETPMTDAIRPDFHAPTAQRAASHAVMGEDSLVSARQIRQPVNSKGDIINAFDGITYQKGAAVIEMFASSMNKAKFQAGVREYIKAHAFGTATAADLLAALSKSAGKDIATPFSTFLDQPGVPYVAASIDCSDKKKPKLTLAQSRFLPIGSTGDRNKTWQIPVCVRVDGASTPTCTTLTAPSMDVPLRSCPKVVHPNNDGVGYYRWSLPPDQLKALSATAKRLTPGERISFANALSAAFNAGSLPFADILGASVPLAVDEEPAIMRAPSGYLGFAADYLVDPAARPQVKSKLIEIYRPILDKIKVDPKKDEDARVRERRGLIIGGLATVAEEPALIADMAKRGRAVLDLDNPDANARKIHLDKVHGDLAGTAIWAALWSGGPAAWDATNALLTNESDSTTRNYLVSALSSTIDPALTPKALELTLDPRLKVNEVIRPIAAQAGDYRTRDAAWAWFKGHADQVVARLPEEYGAAAVVGLFDGYCDEDKAKEVDAFFSQKKIPGGERALAQTLESIRLCAAIKAAHQESARKVFPAPK